MITFEDMKSYNWALADIKLWDKPWEVRTLTLILEVAVV